MKYSPQQRQKERKSESDAGSLDRSPSRGVSLTHSGTGVAVAETRKNSSIPSRTTSRSRICRSPSTGMFAWMRVFRLASMLHQVGC